MPDAPADPRVAPDGDEPAPDDWYIEQRRVPERVVGADGQPDFSYASMGDLFVGAAVLEEGPTVEVALLVHDGGVVVQVSDAAAATLAASAGMPWLAESLGMRPLLGDDPTPAVLEPDKVWMQSTQGPNAVLVLRPPPGSTVFVGLGLLPETLRYQARLIGAIRLDLVVGDDPLLPTLTGRGLAELSARGRGWAGMVSTTDRG
jgi:hypothetical protein